ncbi:hypothetical protein HDU96_003179, partial [Phlyctochytrium bullatum]
MSFRVIKDLRDDAKRFSLGVARSETDKLADTGRRHQCRRSTSKKNHEAEAALGESVKITVPQGGTVDAVQSEPYITKELQLDGQIILNALKHSGPHRASIHQILHKFMNHVAPTWSRKLQQLDNDLRYVYKNTGIPWGQTKKGSRPKAPNPTPFSALKGMPLPPLCSTIAVNALCQTNPHVDPHDSVEGMCIVLPIGEYTGGDLVLVNSGFRLRIPSGHPVAFRSRTITHFNTSFDGVRHSIVFFTDNDLFLKIKQLKDAKLKAEGVQLPSGKEQSKEGGEESEDEDSNAEDDVDISVPLRNGKEEKVSLNIDEAWEDTAYDMSEDALHAGRFQQERIKRREAKMAAGSTTLNTAPTSAKKGCSPSTPATEAQPKITARPKKKKSSPAKPRSDNPKERAVISSTKSPGMRKKRAKVCVSSATASAACAEVFDVVADSLEELCLQQPSNRNAISKYELRPPSSYLDDAGLDAALDDALDDALSSSLHLDADLDDANVAAPLLVQDTTQAKHTGSRAKNSSTQKRKI